MMNRIVYRRPDGGVSIVVPAAKAQRAAETEAAFLTRVRAAIPQDAKDIAIYDETEIPTDRTFRDAWVPDTSQANGPVKVDMPKARHIHRERLRAARGAKFSELDALWMKAIGQGNQAEADKIEAKRQVLRDLPQDPAIDAAKTPEALTAR